jgi:hypothetical protein
MGRMLPRRPILLPLGPWSSQRRVYEDQSEHDEFQRNHDRTAARFQALMLTVKKQDEIAREAKKEDDLLLNVEEILASKHESNNANIAMAIIARGVRHI